MSLRALKTFFTALLLAACANEVQEIGAPSDSSSGGSGSGASGGDDGSGGSAGSSAGTGSSGGTGGSGAGSAGQSGAFGGSTGLGGDGGTTSNGGTAGGGAGGTSGGAGGTSGGAGGAAGGAGGSGGTAPIGECADMIEWVAGMQLTAAMTPGDELTFNNKVFTYAGNMPLWNFEAQCPPEGTRQPWCEQDSSIYKYTLVGPCE